ncbi:hypothetical protein OROGR_001588 [Orobanche gracilis]
MKLLFNLICFIPSSITILFSRVFMLPHHHSHLFRDTAVAVVVGINNDNSCLQHSDDRLFGQYSGEDLIVDEQGLSVDQQGINFDAQQAAEMAQVRDTIANQMWETYRRS